jgi:hypothetical protein
MSFIILFLAGLFLGLSVGIYLGAAAQRGSFLKRVEAEQGLKEYNGGINDTRI